MRHYFHNVRHGNWWGVLDTIGHTLHFPRWLQSRICDRYDRALGVDMPGVTTGTSASANVSIRWKRG